MTRSELVGQVVARTGLSADDAAAAVDALFAVDTGIIARELAGGGAVDLEEFGRFEPRQRYGSAYRPGARPSAEEGPPPAPVFRAGAGWRDPGPRMRGGRKPPRGTGSTGPRRGGSGARDDGGGAP